MNELLLLGTVVLYFSAALLAEKLFGKTGLYLWVVVGSIMMNIEVVKLVEAFSLEMTLGNVLLASTFLATDILNEKYGKVAARKAAALGCFAIVAALVIEQVMLLFEPSAQDFAQSSLETIFAPIPRICFASFLTYFVVQFHDVWLYNKIWEVTSRKYGKDRFLWIRNCGSTIVSQLINAFLFTYVGWLGVYDAKTCLELAIATFAITLVTSFLDTPFMYLSRKFIQVGSCTLLPENTSEENSNEKVL